MHDPRGEHLFGVLLSEAEITKLHSAADANYCHVTVKAITPVAAGELEKCLDAVQDEVKRLEDAKFVSQKTMRLEVNI